MASETNVGDESKCPECLPNCKYDRIDDPKSGPQTIRCCLRMKYYHVDCHNVSKKELKEIWNCATCRNIPAAVDELKTLSSDFVKLSKSSLEREWIIVNQELRLKVTQKELAERNELIRKLEAQLERSLEVKPDNVEINVG